MLSQTGDVPLVARFAQLGRNCGQLCRHEPDDEQTEDVQLFEPVRCGTGVGRVRLHLADEHRDSVDHPDRHLRDVLRALIDDHLNGVAHDGVVDVQVDLDRGVLDDDLLRLAHGDQAAVLTTTVFTLRSLR